MTKLEKTIRGLECCIKRDPEEDLRCDACPQPAGSACANRLKIDALEILKDLEKNMKVLIEGLKDVDDLNIMRRVKSGEIKKYHCREYTIVNGDWYQNHMWSLSLVATSCLYHKIKERWNLRRLKADATKEELKFLVELLDMMEAEDEDDEA